MMILDEVREQFGVMAHPGAKMKARSAREAMAYYYKVALVPLVLSLLLAWAVGSAVLGSQLGASGLAALEVFVALFFLVIEPAGLLFTALVLQLIGANLFKAFKGGYADTLSALVCAALPPMMFMWLLAVPIVGLIVLIIMGIWSFILEIVGVAKMNKTSRLSAFAVLIGGGIIVGVIAYMVMFGILFELGFFSGTGLSNLCMSESGYSCSNVTYSGTTLGFNFAQDTGADWTGWEAAFVPLNASISNGVPQVAFVPMGPLRSGQGVKVSLTVPSSQGGLVDGAIWTCYTTQGAGISGNCTPVGGVASAQAEYAQVASVSAESS